MSLLLAAWVVRNRAKLLGSRSGAFGRHGPAIVLVLVSTLFGSRGTAADFKTLLADAGAIVFGGSSRDEISTETDSTEGRSDEDLGRPVQPEPLKAPTTDQTLSRIARRSDDSKPAADSLTTAPRFDAARAGPDADALLQKLLPARTDTSADWYASGECLHGPGEPHALSPCVPPPPCDPSQPPHPHDLVGVRGSPSCGPIYRGPCQPRTGTHDDSHFPWFHRACDKLFDCFYRSK